MRCAYVGLQHLMISPPVGSQEMRSPRYRKCLLSSQSRYFGGDLGGDRVFAGLGPRRKRDLSAGRGSSLVERQVVSRCHARRL